MPKRELSRCHNTRLGGPETPKKATAAFFVFLWFVYIALSASAA